MSIHALSWALKQDVRRSSEKFVLVCLCNYADEQGYCYPSASTLEKDTSLDRKTILSSIKALCSTGLLIDTGRRVGATKSVIVYQVVGIPESSSTHYVYKITRPDTGEFYIGKRSCAGDAEADSYRGSGRWTRQMAELGVCLHREVLGIYSSSEAALAEEQRLFRVFDLDPLCVNDGLPSKHRARSKPNFGTSPKNGAAPNLDTSSPVFPAEQSRFSVEAVPKTGHRSVIEPSIEPSCNRQRAREDEDGFAEIQSAYPKRGGGQRWGDARKAYAKHLASGIPHADILAGVRRYAEHIRDDGKEGTQYVQQAATFLGENRGFTEPWAPVVRVRELSAVERVALANQPRNRDERVVSEQHGSSRNGMDDPFGDVRRTPGTGLRRFGS